MRNPAAMVLVTCEEFGIGLVLWGRHGASFLTGVVDVQHISNH